MDSSLFSHFAANCATSGFLKFPYWYKYIAKGAECTPQIGSLNDIWLIAAAVVEILLRIAGIAAVAYLIYGGVNYILSQGEPDKTKQARTTITNALGGLIIAIFATAIVTFIARSIN